MHYVVLLAIILAGCDKSTLQRSFGRDVVDVSTYPLKSEYQIIYETENSQIVNSVNNFIFSNFNDLEHFNNSLKCDIVIKEVSREFFAKKLDGNSKVAAATYLSDCILHTEIFFIKNSDYEYPDRTMDLIAAHELKHALNIDTKHTKPIEGMVSYFYPAFFGERGDFTELAVFFNEIIAESIENGNNTYLSIDKAIALHKERHINDRESDYLYDMAALQLKIHSANPN